MTRDRFKIKRNHVVAICIFLAVALAFLFRAGIDGETSKVIESHKQVNSKEVESSVEKGSNRAEFNSSKSHPVSEFCHSTKPFSSEDIAHKEAFAENTHFKKDGEVYRIRVFVEDGQNTSFKKLVYFKEDEDGFPQIIKENGLINPTKEQIVSLMKGGEVIHHEADISIELKDGRSFNYSTVNGKVVKVLDGESGYSCR